MRTGAKELCARALKVARSAGAGEAAALLSDRRDGHLRFAVHFYNHEDDIARVAGALRGL